MNNTKAAYGAAFAVALLVLNGCTSLGQQTSEQKISKPAKNNHAQLAFSTPKTILYDPGGHVVAYSLNAKKLRVSGRQVRFSGKCLSACTAYLSLPKSQTCIQPGASFGFHLPYGGSEKENAVATRYLMKQYPGWVRSWIAANGGLSSRIKNMKYEYARRYLRSCDIG